MDYCGGIVVELWWNCGGIVRDETEGSRPKLIANPRNNEFKY